MKTPQQHAQEILPLVTAQANGEVIQMYAGDEWSDCKWPTAFVDGCKYRVKSKTIFVNGFEVPEPVRESLSYDDFYYVICLDADDFASNESWGHDEKDFLWLSRGLIHLTKEAAIAHAKAMLGIDPNS